MNTNSKSVEDQLNDMKLTEAQKARFYALCQKVQSGEIKMNQAYKYACMDGENPSEDPGFKGPFSKWIETVRKNEWVANLRAKTGGETVPTPEEEGMKHDLPTTPAPKKNYVVPIVIGVSLGLLLIAIATSIQPKKDK